ncbi:cation:dicarboxylase symporter family transporter [Clostridium sp. MSJ-8]|nr:cation:dicarboxylase symporter family transporter [Clostridium sp. MSJ-8]
MITSVNTILFIAVLVGTFYIIRRLEKKKIKFQTRIIVATIIGLILGIIIQLAAGFPKEPSKVTWLNEVSAWYNFFGAGFMDLLKMLVIPLVFTSILRVITNMGEGRELTKVTLKTIGMLVITTVLSAIVGVVIAHMMKLGVGVEVANQTAEIREVTPLVETIRALIPSNVIQAMADGNVIAIIIFAGFLGVAVRRQRKKYSDIIKPFTDVIEGFYKVILSVCMTVIKFMPYAVIAMLAQTICANGLKSMLESVKFIIALYIAVAIVFIIHLVIISINGLSPIRYLKNSTKQLILAFTSRSSLGTLPVTIETLTDEHGVEEGVASLTASLGSNMGMNGCAGIYPALVAVTLANMAGINMDLGFYITLIIVITVGSFGIAGLPGAATMAVSVVVSGIGLAAYFPLAAGIIAIDPILDMGRTMLNVNGASVISITVSNSLNKLNREKFNQ